MTEQWSYPPPKYISTTFKEYWEYFMRFLLWRSINTVKACHSGHTWTHTFWLQLVRGVLLSAIAFSLKLLNLTKLWNNYGLTLFLTLVFSFENPTVNMVHVNILSWNEVNMTNLTRCFPNYSRDTVVCRHYSCIYWGLVALFYLVCRCWCNLVL